MQSDITAIIVEDVETYLLTIEKLVMEVAPDVKIIGKTTSLSMAEHMITELKPRLVLLDIQFEEEGRTAFDMLKSISEKDTLHFGIIFISAHHEADYYSRAFQFGALHFLGKPVDKEKLKEALDRIRQKDPSFQIENFLLKMMKNASHIHSAAPQGKMIIEGNRFNELVDIGKIVFLEASGRYTQIQMENGQSFVVSRNLGEYEKRLHECPGFFRIHHNKIINLNYIRRFSRKERMVELVPPFGSHFASKERFKDFLEYLEKYSMSMN